MHRSAELILELRLRVVVVKRHPRHIGKVPPLDLTKLQIGRGGRLILRLRQLEIGLLPEVDARR